jgi:uncharacterized protein YjbI with pentapeptide repeats
MVRSSAVVLMGDSELWEKIQRHEAWRRSQGRDGARMVEEYGLNLAGVDLRGRALGGVEWPGVDLREASLEGADLGGSHMPEALLDGANLAGALLSKTNADDCSAVKASFRGAILIRTEFHGARLSDTDFSGANLVKVYMVDADLRGAALRGALMRGAGLADADLRDADLRGAELRQAVLGGTRLGGALLAGGVGIDEVLFLENRSPWIEIGAGDQITKLSIEDARTWLMAQARKN